MLITARAQSLVDQFDRVLGAFLLESDHVRLGVRFTGSDAEDDTLSSRVNLMVFSEFVRLCKIGRMGRGDEENNRLQDI